MAQTRLRMGARLAREAPAPADIVVPVPDSGLYAAMGYSRESGLPLEFGITRNHYVGRTFIEPKQSIRNFGVKIKLNPVRELLTGQRVVLVDDSIVRGTTSRKIVRMIREGGSGRGAPAHLRAADRVALPLRDRHPHPQRADRRPPQRSRRSASFIEADSLAYLSLDGMLCRRQRSPRQLLHRLLDRRLPRRSPETAARPSCSRSGRRGSRLGLG